MAVFCESRLLRDRAFWKQTQIFEKSSQNANRRSAPGFQSVDTTETTFLWEKKSPTVLQLRRLERHAETQSVSWQVAGDVTSDECIGADVVVCREGRRNFWRIRMSALQPLRKRRLRQKTHTMAPTGHWIQGICNSSNDTTIQLRYIITVSHRFKSCSEDQFHRAALRQIGMVGTCIGPCDIWEASQATCGGE